MAQTTGAGNDDPPIRYASTPRAQLRPSAIAQTMSDWPRCMSPAVKTPGTLVIQLASRADVAAVGQRDAEAVEHAVAFGADEAHRQQHEVGLSVEFAAGTA